MDVIRFRCYHCQRAHVVKAEAAGKRGRCACGKLMLVPGRPANAPLEGEVDLPLAAPVLEDARTKAEVLASVPVPGSPAVLAAGSARSERAGFPVGSGSSGAASAEALRGRLEEVHGALGSPGTVEPSRKDKPAMLCIQEILLSLIVLAAWAVYQFPGFFGEFCSAALVENPNILSLPKSFWSTVLLVLGLVLLVDGIARWCRR